MKKIIHEDERIIEILVMFANEIKTCRVSDGEAIDKTACMLTAYMEGIIKAKCVPIKIDPMLDELTGWLRELSSWFGEMSRLSQMDCTIDLNMSRSKMWADRAARVDGMGWTKNCDTCRWWETNCEAEVQIGSAFDWCNHPDLRIENQGPAFGCILHNDRKQPPVKK